MAKNPIQHIPQRLSDARRVRLLVQFQEHVAEVRTRLNHLEQAVRRNSVRFIHVPETTVVKHTRRAHWRPYYHIPHKKVAVNV